MITTEVDTTEAREALALPEKNAALRGLCGVDLCGKIDFAGVLGMIQQSAEPIFESRAVYMMPVFTNMAICEILLS